MMENLMHYIDVVFLFISLFAVGILFLGFLVCLRTLVQIAFSKGGREEKLLGLQQARMDLGGFVLLGLEILIVADIIETVVNPTVEDLIKLAAIVAIRTTISFFLHKEIEQIESRLENKE